MKTKCTGSGKLPRIERPVDNRFKNGWCGIGQVLHHCPDGCGRFWSFNDSNNGWPDNPIPTHFKEKP